MKTEISSMLIYDAPKVSFLDSRSHKLESELSKIKEKKKKLHFLLSEFGIFHKKIVFLISQKEILNSGKICLFSPMATSACS